MLDDEGSDVSREARAFFRKALGSTEVKSSGQRLFESHCLNCHQPNGQGLPGLYPPIAKSDWVTGDAKRLIAILIRGANGPIVVNGNHYDGIMPPSGLDNRQIAEVLTWIRGNFGNKAEPVDVESVRQIREALPANAGLWRADE